MIGRRIVVFGDVIDDIVAVPKGPVRVDTDTPASILHRGGGSAANTASWLGALGAEVDFVGIVGKDDVVRHSTLLARSGVTPRLTPHPTLPTGTIVVVVDGQDRTMFTERGANAELDPGHVTDDLLDAATILHFTGYSIFGSSRLEALRALIDRALARGVQISVDPGSAGFIADFGVTEFLNTVAGATIFFPSLEEGQLLTGLSDPDAVAAALADTFEVVALTLGERGAIVAARGAERVHVAAIDVQIVDPTGAGDAFSAGFLSVWAERQDVGAAAEAGVATAARAVSVIGARPLLAD